MAGRAEMTSRHRVCTLATCNLNQWAMDFSGNLQRIQQSIAEVCLSLLGQCLLQEQSGASPRDACIACHKLRDNFCVFQH